MENVRTVITDQLTYSSVDLSQSGQVVVLFVIVDFLTYNNFCTWHAKKRAVAAGAAVPLGPGGGVRYIEY